MPYKGDKTPNIMTSVSMPKVPPAFRNSDHFKNFSKKPVLFPKPEKFTFSSSMPKINTKQVATMSSPDKMMAFKPLSPPNFYVGNMM